MNIPMSIAEYEALPHRDQIISYPTPGQKYRDGGGVSIAQFTRENNWSEFYWWHFWVTFFDEQSSLKPYVLAPSLT
jgi:hypothetical protein